MLKNKKNLKIQNEMMQMVDESRIGFRKKIQILKIEILDTTLRTNGIIFRFVCTSNTFTFSLEEKGATRTTWGPRDLRVRKLIADKLSRTVSNS